MREISVAVGEGLVGVLASTQNFGLTTVSGVGLAIQPDIPPHRAEMQGGLLVPASSVVEAEGCDRDQV